MLRAGLSAGEKHLFIFRGRVGPRCDGPGQAGPAGNLRDCVGLGLASGPFHDIILPVGAGPMPPSKILFSHPAGPSTVESNFEWARSGRPDHLRLALSNPEIFEPDIRSVYTV